MKVAILASGSAGNATLFSAQGTSVLVDAGIGPRTLARKLGEIGADLPQAIIITHAHQDHVGHCLKLSKRLKIPVYASEATSRCEALRGREQVRVYDAREPFVIGALTIAPTPLPHDAAQVALTFSDGAHKAGIVTDLGEVPPGLLPHLAGCQLLLIESNHDADLLQRGPYPAFLKRRIGSARGHLSNAQTHALLQRLPCETSAVVLMHLSTTNNRPELALSSAMDALSGRKVQLSAASQDELMVFDVAALPPPPALRPRRPSQLVLFDL
ncbi:MAG: MBL fold metallo-hydrolase [Minicystis sp.]